MKTNLKIEIWQYVMLIAVFIMIFDQKDSIAQEAIPSKKDWRNGYSLMIINNPEKTNMNNMREMIIKEGGVIAIFSRPIVMLGWLSHEVEHTINAKTSNITVYREVVDPVSLGIRDTNNLIAIDYFNYVVSGEAKLSELKGGNLESSAQFFNNCVRQGPIDDQEEVNENLKRFGITASRDGTSEYMSGTVAVCLFFVESDGTNEPDEFNWTLADQNTLIFESMDGLSWWASMAPHYGENVSFTVYQYWASNSVCQQGWEPIRHPHDNEYLWVNPIMANLGFTSGSHISRVKAFNEWLRDWAETDYSYSVFIGYNPPPAPITFTDGINAFAYGGGPFAQLLLHNSGNGPDEFGEVLAHESGHIFWACDEYSQSSCDCAICDDAPGRSIPNSNCENCNPNAVSCMMRCTGYDLCPYTPLQIGWQLKTWVEFSYTGTQQGTFAKPYKTFQGGVNNVTSGTWLFIKSGQSNESGNFPMTITKQMTIDSWNGTATIGH